MAERSDVLVIGGGVVGVCSAYFLAEQGMQVTLIDRGEICSGSSYGNAGLVVPSHCVPLAAPGVIRKALKWMFNPESPFYVKPRMSLELFTWLWRFRAACNVRHRDRAMPLIRDLSLKSVELFDAFAAMDDMDFAYQKNGMLQIFDTGGGLAEGVAEGELARGVGLEVEVLDASGVRERLSGLATRAVGGVFYPQDAHMVPAQFVRALAKKVERMGVCVRPHTELMGFDRNGRSIRAVRTTRGEFAAGEVVLAAGSWSADLARRLDLKLSMQPAKGYSITFKRPDDFPFTPFMCMEAKVGVTPMGDMLRLAGTLELAGMDMSINQRRVRAVLRAADRYLPELDTETLQLLEIWRGLRPCTPDGLPYLGRPAGWDNLVIAAGHAMIGLSLGPVTGKLVSELAAREETAFDLTLLRIGR